MQILYRQSVDCEAQMCVVSDKLVTFARQNFEPFCSLRTWLAAKRRFGEMKRRFRKIKRRFSRAERRFGTMNVNN